MKKILLFAMILNICSCTSLQNESVTSFRYQPPQTGNISNFHLFINYNDRNNIIKKGEIFSVKLVSAHICDFDESSMSGNFRLSNSRSELCEDSDDFFKSQRTGTQGEIAIIANIGEQSANSGLTLTTQDFDDQGRVVYYNEDVRESGHLLNFINIPLYGPIKYEGKPFYIEFAVTEIDSQENKKMQALMGQLASLGEIAYPPAAPILSVLNSLGGALIKGNKDDVLMRFQAGFDLEPGTEIDEHSDMSRLELREGYYALVSEETRSKNTDWDGLHVNEDLGLITLEGKKIPYRQRTWLLLKISRESQESGLGQKIGKAVSEFQKNLDTNSDVDLKIVEDALVKLKNKPIAVK